MDIRGSTNLVPDTIKLVAADNVIVIKIFANVSTEIYHRKNEYISFIKTVKDEEFRVEIRKFVSDKISEVNDLISVYEDEASIIIKEEFKKI